MLDHRLKVARKNNKLTQEQLAQKVQTTKGTISNYENGHSTPSNEMLVLLARTLNTSTDYLLGNTDKFNNEANHDEDEFQTFINDPELGVWYKELPKSDEDELRKLRTIWEMIKAEKNK